MVLKFSCTKQCNTIYQTLHVAIAVKWLFCLLIQALAKIMFVHLASHQFIALRHYQEEDWGNNIPVLVDHVFKRFMPQYFETL
jgi:hypothetical protein